MKNKVSHINSLLIKGLFLLAVMVVSSCSSVQKLSNDVERTSTLSSKKDSLGAINTRRTDFGTINKDEFKITYTPLSTLQPITLDDGKDTIYIYNATVEKHYIQSSEKKDKTEQIEETAELAETTETTDTFTQQIDELERRGMKFIAVLIGGFVLLIVLLAIIFMWFVNKKINQFKIPI